jgi:hypothetical protein
MATPVVFDTSVGFWSDDIVRSITATPAGSVIQINPKAIQPEPVVELPVAVAEDVVGIDDVMEEWASMMMEDSVSQDIPVSKMLVSSPTSSENTQSDGDNRSLDLLMAGMALGAVVSKSRKSKDQQ